MENFTSRLFLTMIVSISSLTISCGRLEDRLREQADIQGEAAAVASDELSRSKSIEMEKELQEKLSYYQALSGEFSGLMEEIDSEEPELGGPGTNLPPEDDLQVPAEVRFLFVPTVWPYSGGRVRTIEEISTDMVQLSLDIMLNLTLPTGSRYSCAFTDVRPKPETGELFLISAECIHQYVITPASILADSESLSLSQRIQKISPQGLRSGGSNAIEHILVRMRSNRVAQEVTILLERTP